MFVVGVLLFLAVSSGGLSAAQASLAASSEGTVQITSPADGAVLGDGDLFLLEGTATAPPNSTPLRIEVSVDGGSTWAGAEIDTPEPGRWRYLWSDPPAGSYQIQVHSLSATGAVLAQQRISARVADAWTSPFVIDCPYALAGTYRKGQLHVHTTGSFDGWESLPPAADALEYKRLGYQFVVLTDHEALSYPTEVNDGTFLVIPGFESTSAYGHIAASFTTQLIDPGLPTQQRLDAITGAGGLAILAHPDWQVGWTEADFRELHGFFAFDIFNGLTTTTADRVQQNAELWRRALNTKGGAHRIWAVAVDDAHKPGAMDKGWVMVKTAQLTAEALQRSLQNGAFYASNGPSFRVLGILRAAITASSPEAARIRFIDQDGVIVAEGPGAWAGYRPTGRERWIRVEAVMADGRTAWSQPFWLRPNAPRVDSTAGPG